MTAIGRTLCIVGLLAIPHFAFGQAKPDPTIDLFKPVGPVPVFKVTVDADNLKLLAKDARKYVRATIRVGSSVVRSASSPVRTTVMASGLVEGYQ